MAKLVYPVLQPFRITSKYGWRTLNGKKQFHDGIDFASNVNNGVIAVHDGIIAYDQDDYDHSLRWIDRHHSAGNMFILDFLLGGSLYHLRYLHIVKNMVSKGDLVKTGAPLGVYGDVGISYGAHVHIDLYDKNWKKIDPTNFFGAEVTTDGGGNEEGA